MAYMCTKSMNHAECFGCGSCGPKVVRACDGCGGDICAGDPCWDVFDHLLCAVCIADAQTTAEEDE